MRHCGPRWITFVILFIGLALAGFAASASIASSARQSTTTTPPCTRAHPCTPAECAVVGAHGGDCATPSTTTTTTPPSTTRPRCSNGSPGGAGHDGQPGTDDCALTPLTTTTPTTTPTTTTTTSSSTEAATTTTSSTTTTAPFTPPTAPKAKKPKQNPLSATGKGTLPFTGSRSVLIAALLGTLLIAAGLGLRGVALASPPTVKRRRVDAAVRTCQALAEVEDEVTQLVRDATHVRGQRELKALLAKLRIDSRPPQSL